MRAIAACLALAGLAACSDAGAEDVPVSSPKSSPEPVAEATSEEPGVARLAAPSMPGGFGCASDETPVFACGLDNGKRVAVCSTGERQGQYRYGGDRRELQIDGGEYAYAMYSGGGGGQIAFENAGHRYIVFSRMVRTNFAPGEPNDPAMSDGVIVLRGADFVGMHLCEGGDTLSIQVSPANGIWEDQGELFTDETIRADPEWAREEP